MRLGALQRGEFDIMHVLACITIYENPCTVRTSLHHWPNSVPDGWAVFWVRDSLAFGCRFWLELFFFFGFISMGERVFKFGCCTVDLFSEFFEFFKQCLHICVTFKFECLRRRWVHYGNNLTFNCFLVLSVLQIMENCELLQYIRRVSSCFEKISQCNNQMKWYQKR